MGPCFVKVAPAVENVLQLDRQSYWCQLDQRSEREGGMIVLNLSSQLLDLVQLGFIQCEVEIQS